MSPQENVFSVIRKVYNTSVKSLRNHPVVLLPFLIFTIIELFALFILYSAPRMPLRVILGPVIRTLWSEAFLHYPTNFLLLPKLNYLSNMALSIIVGSLLTAATVAIVFDIYTKKQIKLGNAFKSAFKNYAFLFIVVLIFIALYYFLSKIIIISLARYFMSGHSKLLFVHANLWMGPILMGINFVLALFIQSAFTYAIPVIMIEKGKIIKAIGKSFVLFKRLFIPTIILVGLPMLLYIPFIIFNSNIPLLMNRFFPEVALVVLGLGTVFSCLVIDFVITVSTTVLYLESKAQA